MMGCRSAAKSKVEEGCGRRQLEAAFSSSSCTQVIEHPAETRVVQKGEDRGPISVGDTEEEDEEEDLTGTAGSSQRTFGLYVGRNEYELSR